MRRVLCVWFPRLATECLSRAEEDGGRPVVTVVHGGTEVAAVSEAAEAAGVKPGMGWGDARARCPSLLASPPDHEGEARAMRAAARAAERYGPWVVREMDDLLVDVTGTPHLFGGERAMLEDCRRVFAERGWSIRAAVASAAGAARGLARFAETDLAVGTPEEVRQLPVEALGLDAGSAARLRRVGLRRVGDLASRPRTALAERFGEGVLRGLDRMLEANGSGSEPLGVRPSRPRLRVHWEGMEPLGDPASVEAVSAALLEKLCARLRRGDLGARKMILVLGFDAPRSERRRVEVHAGRGLRDPGRWLALFRERPEAFDPGGGVVRLDLAAVAAEPFDPVPGADREGLWERLSARLGPRNLVRFRPAARHRPEAAFEAEPVLPPASRSAPGSASEGIRAHSFAAAADGGNPRPLRLLASPEPVGVESGPDDPLDPPTVLRLRDGRPVRLRTARGPERIVSEWWGEGEGAGGREDGLPAGRDYWQVETEEGARLWLYRALHPGPAVRWFLHGFFP